MNGAGVGLMKGGEQEGSRGWLFPRAGPLKPASEGAAEPPLPTGAGACCTRRTGSTRLALTG